MPFLSSPPDPIKGGFTGIQIGVAETLFKLGRDLKPEPWLATSARQVDERTWEIGIREGVKFHDGSLMDAAAVKASLERAVSLHPTAAALLDIARIDAPSAPSLTVVTNGPSPILPGLLTDPTTAIVNAAIARTKGETFTNEASLTGPYKIERFQLDREAVVVRHREYWGPQPQLERVHFSYLPDNQSRVLALRSGDIDIAVYIAPESVPTVRNDPGLTVKPAAPVALEFLYLNHRRDPWKDLRVRQAVAHAINRDELVRAVMAGEGIVAASVFPPVFLRCEGAIGPSFDVARAGQLLAEAGYRDADGDGYVERDGQGLVMRLLTYRQRPELVPMGEAIQGSLRTVGIRVEVALVEQIDAELERGRWDGALYFNNMTTTGDPYWALSSFFVSGGSANRGGYRNPQVDELAARTRRASGRGEREQLACAASHTVVDDLAIVPLLYPHVHYGASRKVSGFEEPHPFFLYFLDSAIGKR